MSTAKPPRPGSKADLGRRAEVMKLCKDGWRRGLSVARIHEALLAGHPDVTREEVRVAVVQLVRKATEDEGWR